MKKLGNKGFTLVELLATIAVLSLVVTIVIYTATVAIDDAKEKSYQVTMNNIVNSAVNYVSEQNEPVLWKNESNSEYRCITIESLIEKGYFDNDLLNAEINENVKCNVDDLIYIERNKKSKVINKKILLIDQLKEIYSTKCVYVIGDINFSVEAVGEKINGWAKEKEIAIEYNIYDNMGQLSKYSYDYQYSGDDIEPVVSKPFSRQTINETFNVTKNGEVNANIYVDDEEKEIISSAILKVNKIDNEGPVVELNGNTLVDWNKVIVPLKIVDKGVGIDENDIDFTLEDIEVTIGGNDFYVGSNKEYGSLELEKINNLNYRLIIDNDIQFRVAEDIEKRYGDIKIKILSNKLSDKLGNNNVSMEIDSGMSYWFLDINSIIGTDKDTGRTNLYGRGCAKIYINGIQMDDVTTKQCKGYGEGSRDDYYSIWPYGTKYEIKDIVGIDGYEFVGILADNGAPLEGIIGENIDYLTPNRTNVLMSFENRARINYDSNGGEGTMNYSLCGKDNVCSIDENKFTKVGYTFVEWNTKADGTGNRYSAGNNIEVNNNITLYAQWRVNTVTIKYNVNSSNGEIDSDAGGNNWSINDNGYILLNGQELKTVINYNGSMDDNGLANYNNQNYVSVSNTGWDAVPGSEWKCIDGCIDNMVVFDHSVQYEYLNENDEPAFCDASVSDCTITIGVNWYYAMVDLNGILDGIVIYDICNYGFADIYKNGKEVAVNSCDYYSGWNYGDRYEFKNIRSVNGKINSGIFKGNLSGVIGDNNSGLYLIFNTPEIDGKELRIFYNANHSGGSVTFVNHGSFVAKTRENEGWIYKIDGNVFLDTYDSRDIINLWNYNYSPNFIVSKKVNGRNCSVPGENEWYTINSSGEKITFSQSTNYSYNYLTQNAVDKGTHYELKLYINWSC